MRTVSNVEAGFGRAGKKNYIKIYTKYIDGLTENLSVAFKMLYIL